MDDMESQTRSTTFSLITPDDKLQAIRNSIRRYRAALKQMFAVLTLAQTAGAKIIEKDESLKVNPDNDAATLVLENAMGKSGKAMGYQLREYFLKELYPNAMSFVWDGARRDLESRWKASDPEFPKAKRGWLTLQGARGLAQFSGIGISFPVATSHPKLNDHVLTLKWDHSIGDVQFRLPRMDRGGRYYVWKNIRNRTPGWKLGTSYLNERDGKIVITITHERPVEKSNVDPEREMRVVFGGESNDTLCCLIGPDDHLTFDSISSAEAIGWLNKQRINRLELEGRRASSGAPRRPWGHRKGFEHAQNILSNLTKERDRRQESTNHAWTRRIVSRAEQWRCGVVKIQEFPEKDIHTHPWSWYQFRQFLEYKCTEKGIKIQEG